MRVLLDYLLGNLLLHYIGDDGVCEEVSVWRSEGNGGNVS